MDTTNSAQSVPPPENTELAKSDEPPKVDGVEMKEAVPAAAEEGKDAIAAEKEPATANGEARHLATEEHLEPTASSPTQEDTEMKDASEIAAPVGATPTSVSASAPTNGTPVSLKRGGNTGSSKKKAGVPEHKSKKLQKKKSRPLTNLEAEPGQYFFARMKGHPPWPSIICDEAMLPVSLLTTRPVTARLPDQTFKKPEYEDGGKRAHERTFPVMFLHTNEFAWIPNTELTPLDHEDESIKNPAEKGKSKTLLAAYAKASEANDLTHFKNMLADHQKALAEDQAEREERAAKKAKKASRKSADAATLADEDEMDVDNEDGAAKSKSKKRKKAEDSDVDEKPAKTPKTATKLKLSEPKTPAESQPKKKTPKSKAKPAKASSDEDGSTAKPEDLTPETALGIKERKVLYFRHKLQRSMLNRESIPKEDEMKAMSDFLSELETYPDLEASIIRKTKIHKVLKNIIKLDSIPLEGEFKFKDRSRELLSKWNEILSKDPSGGAAAEQDDKADEKPDDVKPDASASITNGASEPSPGKLEDTGRVTEENEEANVEVPTEGAKEAKKPAAESNAQPELKAPEEKGTDGLDVESKPEAEYKPPAVTEATPETTV